jgi:hypothetical protein
MTVVLSASLKQRALARAREQGISLGEFIRRALEQTVGAPPLSTSRNKAGDPFWDNLKTYDDGPSDLASHHDNHLYGGKS